MYGVGGARRYWRGWQNVFDLQRVIMDTLFGGNFQPSVRLDMIPSYIMRHMNLDTVLGLELDLGRCFVLCRLGRRN